MEEVEALNAATEGLTIAADDTGEAVVSENK
jgi:hypothetical protein